MLTKQIGIDLGTVNLLVAEANKGIVFREPSVVAIVEEKGRTKLMAVGLEAKEIYTTSGGAFDLIISDVVMPEMSGIELFEFISEENADIKFLFISGYAPGKAFKNYSNLKNVHLLQKPYRNTEIANKIRDILDS